MAIGGMLILIPLLVLIVGGFGLGLWLVVTARRARGGSAPTCGQCEYNLTGLEGNRCPECGKLFIEAGVLIDSTGDVGGRDNLGPPIGEEEAGPATHVPEALNRDSFPLCLLAEEAIQCTTSAVAHAAEFSR